MASLFFTLAFMLFLFASRYALCLALWCSRYALMRSRFASRHAFGQSSCVFLAVLVNFDASFRPLLRVTENDQAFDHDFPGEPDVLLVDVNI